MNLEYNEPLKKLSEFLIECGAQSMPHSGKRLYDHLMSTYCILADHELEVDVCLGGGLHSILGTNAYKEILTDNKNKLLEVFGQKITNLVALFNSINRPFALEKPTMLDYDNQLVILLDNNNSTIEISLEDYYSLCFIESANLIEQNGFRLEKYPTLHEIWDF
jgi:(p)ppGpp synthase/HD superfamily hydrolase